MNPQGTSPAPEHQLDPEPEFEINLGEYLRMVRRHWRLLAAICLVSVVSSVIHYAITPKAYLAQVKIQIERRSLSPLVVNTQNPWLDAYNLEFYPTQYKLLESRGLAEKVVKNLDLMDDPTFNPGALHPTRPARGPRIVSLHPGGEAIRSTAEEDLAALGRLADGLRGGLTVEPIRNTELVVLSYQHSSPEFAARVVNGFAEAFIDMGIENRYATAGKASSFLTTQIATLKQEIDDKDAQLQEFSRKKDIVTLAPGSSVLLQRLETLNNSYGEAKKTRIEHQAEYEELLHKPKDVLSSDSTGPVAEARTELSRLEREYESKLKIFKPDWPAMVDLNGQIERAKQHLAKVVNDSASAAQQEALSNYQTALRQEQSLETELNKLKSQAMDQSSESVQYSNLRVEVQTRRDMLNELLRKQSETEVTARLQDTHDSNIHIIDRALVPSGPFYPSLRRNVSTGLTLGLLIGIGLALLLEFLDRTLKVPEEVERRLGLPTLAIIPDLADAGKGYGYAAESEPAAQTGRPPAANRAQPGQAGQPGQVAPRSQGRLDRRKGLPEASQIELVPHLRPRTPISEAYRSLRTALLLSTASELKVIAVTSAEAGEGKTATATNLAVVLAQLGRQVLLVDGDLRKPRLHQIFRVSNRTGLVNQLTAGTLAEPVCLRTEVANLWLTPSGPLAPNPSELLASERMREWLAAMRSHFDFVVVDTPPVLAVTDATLVGAVADGVVLTLRSGKLTREDALACRDRLRLGGIRILGVVLNRYRAVQGGLGRRYSYYATYGGYEGPAPAGAPAQ